METPPTDEIIRESPHTTFVKRKNEDGKKQILQFGTTPEDIKVKRSGERINTLVRGFLVDQNIIVPSAKDAAIEKLKRVFGRSDRNVSLSQSIEAHIVKNTEVGARQGTNTDELSYDRGVCAEAVSALLGGLRGQGVSEEQQAVVYQEIHKLLMIGLSRTEKFDHGHTVDPKVVEDIAKRLQEGVPAAQPNLETGLTLQDELAFYRHNLPLPKIEVPQEGLLEAIQNLPTDDPALHDQDQEAAA